MRPQQQSTLPNDLNKYAKLRRNVAINFITTPLILLVFIYMFSWETLITEMRLVFIILGISYLVNIVQFFYYHHKYKKLKQATQPKSHGIERM